MSQENLSNINIKMAYFSAFLQAEMVSLSTEPISDIYAAFYMGYLFFCSGVKAALELKLKVLLGALLQLGALSARLVRMWVTWQQVVSTAMLC